MKRSSPAPCDSWTQWHGQSPRYLPRSDGPGRRRHGSARPMRRLRSASNSSHCRWMSAASSGVIRWSGARGRKLNRSTWRRVRSMNARASATVMVAVLLENPITLESGIGSPLRVRTLGEVHPFEWTLRNTHVVCKQILALGVHGPSGRWGNRKGLYEPFEITPHNGVAASRGDGCAPRQRSESVIRFHFGPECYETG